MPKKPDWPPELKEPFDPHRIADRAVKGLISNEGAAERISEAFISEVKRRVSIMAGYLDDMPRLPQSETEWLRLIYYLCRYWHIPAFEESSKKRGAKQKWTDQKRKDSNACRALKLGHALTLTNCMPVRLSVCTR
jgi:hypothetical protein